jgi:hypothetical protein
MAWVRVVVGVGIAWLLSLVVTVAGLELAHRMVIATERGTTALARPAPAQAHPRKVSTVSWRATAQ